MLPRGVRPTPATPSVQASVEEGVRAYNGRRSGGDVEGRRAFGRGEGIDLPARSRVLIGETPSVDGAIRPRGAGSVITAYVPPGAPTLVERTYRGRPVPEGRDAGAAPFVAGTNTASSTANSSAATSPGFSAGTAAAQAAQSAQSAQAARSAESRATVNADRGAATGRVPPQP